MSLDISNKNEIQDHVEMPLVSIDIFANKDETATQFGRATRNFNQLRCEFLCNFQTSGYLFQCTV